MRDRLAFAILATISSIHAGVSADEVALRGTQARSLHLETSAEDFSNHDHSPHGIQLLGTTRTRSHASLKRLVSWNSLSGMQSSRLSLLEYPTLEATLEHVIERHDPPSASTRKVHIVPAAERRLHPPTTDPFRRQGMRRRDCRRSASSPAAGGSSGVSRAVLH